MDRVKPLGSQAHAVLGHWQFETTQDYAEVNLQRAVDAMERLRERAGPRQWTEHDLVCKLPATEGPVMKEAIGRPGYRLRNASQGGLMGSLAEA